jgi:hypothetical protein
MKKLSGLVIDFNDDAEGDVLRSVFPSREDVPELLKNASAISQERLAELPDDVFALVMHDGDEVSRKFACVDAGNTALSVLYFVKNAHKLPVAAQKVAAANLCTACAWYDFDPPEELQKIALGLGTAAHLALMGPEAVRTSKAGVQRNMQLARQSGSKINPAILGS